MKIVEFDEYTEAKKIIFEKLENRRFFAVSLGDDGTTTTHRYKVNDAEIFMLLEAFKLQILKERYPELEF